MKTKLTLLISALATIVCQAATWTFHSFQDNCVWVTLGESWNGYPWHNVGISFDYAWDKAFPSQADSGLFWWDGTIQVMPCAESITVDASNDWHMTSFMVDQGYPDYNGSWNGMAENDLSPGEYWIDFASDGNYRIQAIPPSDFGKWAWDGTINPSWVEPLAARKQHGKGHQK